MRDDDDLADFVENENKSIREFPKKIFSLPFRAIKYLIDFLLSIIDAFSKTSKIGFAILILATILILQIIQSRRMDDINAQMGDINTQMDDINTQINDIEYETQDSWY